MKTNSFSFFLLAAFFVGLSSSVYSQSGSGYDYVVAAGANFTLSAGDYGSTITIGVPNGGDFELYAPVGSTGNQWDTENCGSPVVDQVTSCGPGTYNLWSDQGLIDFEIIWYIELGQPGEDFFEIVGSDTTIAISGNFTNAQWGEVGQSGTLGFSMGPLVPGKKYWIMTFDASSHLTNDTCTISSAGTAVEEVLGAKVSVYPNPTNGKINIKTQEQIEKITVLDITGKIILETTNTEIDLINQPKGSYFMKIQTKKGIFTEKIVLE